MLRFGVITVMILQVILILFCIYKIKFGVPDQQITYVVCIVINFIFFAVNIENLWQINKL